MLLVYLKRRCYPLFSSKFLIGQLYSNWPGSSSRTVTILLKTYRKVLTSSNLAYTCTLFKGLTVQLPSFFYRGFQIRKLSENKTVQLFRRPTYFQYSIELFSTYILRTMETTRAKRLFSRSFCRSLIKPLLPPKLLDSFMERTLVETLLEA